MRTFLETRDLHVTDEWIKAGQRTFAFTEIGSVWAARPPRQPRTARLVLAAGVSCLVVVALLLSPAGPWIRQHWLLVVFGVPVVALLIVWLVGLDLLAHHVETRRHHLWIATKAGPLAVWSENEVEVNKALRAITRAREYRKQVGGTTPPAAGSAGGSGSGGPGSGGSG